MKRKIKFRAWGFPIGKTSGEKEMFFVDSYYWEEWGCSGYNLEECMKDDDVLMQYTGLKDKNGKEIYEGDILNRITKGYGNERIIVKYGQDCVNAEGDSEDQAYGYNVSQYFALDSEVIGNIYQNPKLIK